MSFAAIGKKRPRWDDDFVDRLHHRYWEIICSVLFSAGFVVAF